MSHLDTRTRIRPSRLVPDGRALVDLGFVLVLTGVALSGLATSFTGWSFLVVGMTGAIFAVVVTHLARSLGWPLVAPVLVLALVFFLLGGPLTLRSVGDTAFIPGGQTLSRLVDQAIHGWKDLLTTLPPVDGDGPLLVLPWLLGLVSGLLGTSLADLHLRRAWLRALLPVLGLTAVLATVILLGVRHPQSLVLQGSVFAGLALGWLALRTRRATATVHGGTSGWGRLLVGAALVALASALAVPASALVMGDDSDRTVVRNWVEPPFDIGRYPSPLAGFRKYVDPLGKEDATNVYDRTLFTIEGVPAGSRVRFATMDHYDGMVWGASDNALPEPAADSFQRVSSTIDNPVEGEEVEATVTIGEAYDGVWLPTVGALQSLDFRTGDPEEKAEVFRYNLATSTAVVPTGLHEGDTYTFTAVAPDDTIDATTVASAAAVAPPEGTTFLKAPAAQWTAEATTPIERVRAIAEHLRREGKYSDGVRRSEQVHHPGHSIRRLSEQFLQAPQIVGNDEQYAAAMALLAGEVGVPARVVLGAEVPQGGVVTGEDVSAWVELRAADGSWRTLDTEEFMSEEPPADELPESNTPMTGTIIPPPAPIPPPSDAGDQADADLKERKADKKEADADDEESVVASLPGWVLAVVAYVGGPLLAVLLALGAVVGLKLLRRRRRRTAASVSARFVGAWRELVDQARDLGQPVPLGPTVTRREQSGSIGSEAALPLARRADSHVFGPAAPDPGAAASYWESIDAERRRMRGTLGRRRQLLAAVSLRSLRPSGASVRRRR